jgi:hypothetical protein
MLLLDMKPRPLIPELMKTKVSMEVNDRQYGRCPAFVDTFRNYFFINPPFDIEVSITEDGRVVSDKKDWVTNRDPSFVNRWSVDFDIGWLMFSDKSIMMRQYHPYFHNTTFGKHGVVAGGGFDISSWYRPLATTMHLWENVNDLVIKKNEPMFYMHFETEKKIIFKQYYLTDRLQDIAMACADSPNVMRNTITDKYHAFHRGKLNKIVLAEIKKNIIE